MIRTLIIDTAVAMEWVDPRVIGPVPVGVILLWVSRRLGRISRIVIQSIATSAISYGLGYLVTPIILRALSDIGVM